ncbi:MAG: xylulokinase [Clostridiales bacterium]|nr:xylulokinase [Clostridiales bacterium]
MAYLIGIDIGTSGTKTVLFDLEGNTIASASYEYPMSQPQMGWAEQDPADWWEATYLTIAEVMKKKGAKKTEIKGLGLSGQMHGMVLFGKDNNILRPSIIWCDQRTTAQCEKITNLVGAKRLVELTANPALTGFTAGKVMWVKDNQPEIYEKITKILLPKDYIRFKLTGEFATEVSDASGMQYLNVAKRQWSKEVLDKLDVQYEWLAPVYESYEISGLISKEAAELTGLAEGTPVGGGAGDQAAGAVGNGIVRSGIISATIGTSGVVFAHTDTMNISSNGSIQTFCHAVPHAWHNMGVTNGAGLSYRWLRDEMCSVEKIMGERLNVDPYELMGQQAQQVEPGCSGLLYLPYLMGERTPHLDADAKGVFFGISAKHDRRYMIRSVMEGVSYSLLDCLNMMRDMGVNTKEIRASGGGGRSSLWRQIMADMFNTDICTINSKEGGALGVALLAGVGVGVYSSVPEACDATIKQVSKLSPILENAKVYEKYYEVYKGLYPSLKTHYKAVSQIISET